MRVDGSLAGGASEILVFSVGDVLLRLGVPVLLRQTKVNDVDLVGLLAQSDEEIIRLYVTVNEVLSVHQFYARDHLVAQHQHCLQRELATTEGEELLQRGP